MQPKEKQQQTGSNSEGSIAASEANEEGARNTVTEPPVMRPQEAGDYERLLAKAVKILNWMPRRCRYDPENPPSFTLGMNILLAFVRNALRPPKKQN